MLTNNIISTPEITGNIGSCTTQVAVVESRRISWLKKEFTSIATNSCTGKVTTYVTWSYTKSGFWFYVGGLLIALSLIGFIKLLFKPND